MGGRETSWGVRILAQLAAVLVAGVLWFVLATIVHFECGGGLGLFGEDPNEGLDTACRDWWLVPVVGLCLLVLAVPALWVRWRRRRPALAERPRPSSPRLSGDAAP